MLQIVGELIEPQGGRKFLIIAITGKPCVKFAEQFIGTHGKIVICIFILINETQFTFEMGIWYSKPHRIAKNTIFTKE
jgi:hypothetical protein